MPRLTFTRAAVAALVIGGTAPVVAQSSRSTPPTRPATTSATSPSDSLAKELLTLLQVERTMKAGMDEMLNAQLQGNPMMEPYRDVLRTWASKYLTWEVMGARLTRLYTETFTADELRQMLDFYHTPVGRKVAEMTPELTQRGAKIGAEIAQEHQAELEQMIRARAQQLQSQSKPPR